FLMTTAHTVAQAMVAEGRISESEANAHSQRSVLSRVLDGSDDARPDIALRSAIPGDRYLLSSDGLFAGGDHQTIWEVLVGYPDPEHAARRLVDKARSAGVTDDVTCIVADVVPRTAHEDPRAHARILVGAVAEDDHRTPVMGRPPNPAQDADVL